MPQPTINTPREETHQRIADALEDMVDKMVDTSSASNIDYDNTQSGLSANKVQGAVDELASEKADKSTTLAGYGITDAYTKAEVYTQSEVNNIVSTLETNIDWKEAVNTYADIATTYPNPQDGWTVNVKDTDYTYRYNGSEWVAISANAIPEATTSVKGLMTPTQVSKLNGIETGAQVNTVTSVAGKTGAVTLTKSDVGLGNVDNTSDLDKPISTAAQTALNSKVDKATGKGLSTNDYTNEEKQKNADNASAIEDLQEDISQSLSATGNPITIESSESNLVECVAEVEAVQDLHGYDHPWVGGAGKNKFGGGTFATVNTSCTYDESAGKLRVTSTGGGGQQASYTIDAANLVGKTFTFSISGYTMSKTAFKPYVAIYKNDGEIFVSNLGSAGSGITKNSTTFTVDSSTNNLTFLFRIDQSGTATSGDYLEINGIQLELGSSVTAFEPYSNICPISGRSEVEIDRVGKNLFDELYPNIGSTIQYKAVYVGDGEFTLETTTPRLEVDVACALFLLAGNVDTGAGNDTNGVYNEQSRTVTALNGYVTIAYRVYGNINPVNYETILYKTTDRQTYTIQLGDTVYGGTLDVTRGKMVVDKKYKVFNGSEVWYIGASWDNCFYTVWGNDSAYDTSVLGHGNKIISNSYKGVAKPITNLNNGEILFNSSDISKIYANICVKNESYSNTSDFTANLANNPIQLVYELATPITIPLTPQQIRLLKGTNNISCNTGDLSIKYYPDNVLGQLKGDIEGEYDERITELEEKANTPTIKQVEINRNAVSTDGSVMFTALTGYIIVGTSISNDANGDKCVGIPYSMGNVPSLKIMNESTMAVLPNITISGTLYCIKL